MSKFRIVLTVIAVITSLTLMPSVKSEEYCGATIGYNLTKFVDTDIIVDRHRDTYFDYFNLCGRVRNVNCLNNYVGCETVNTVTVVINWGYEALTAPWSYVNSSNPSQGVVWTTNYVANVVADFPNPIRRARLTLLCNINAPNPIAEAYDETWDSRDPWVLTTYYRVFTNLVCGGPVFLPPTLTSSTGSGNGPPGPSTSITLPTPSSSGSTPGCNGASLQPWYFSYTAIISSTYTIHFYGTFYTAIGIPSEIRFLPVFQIQGTWVVTINGVPTLIPVNRLNPSVSSLVNVNGGTLFPLQGQSWSFYVGTELVTLGGNGVYPVILNSTLVVQSGGFTYANNPLAVGAGGC